MDKKKLARIALPVCIVLVIAGIWVVKNSPGASKLPEIPVEHEDFILETDAIDLERLTSHGLPIIIDFGADSCLPCKEMAPVLVSLNAQMQGKAIIKFVDVWKHGGAAADFPVQVIPTQIFFNADGTPYVPGDQLEMDFTLYHYKDSGEHAFTVHQGGLNEQELRHILADMGVEQ